MEQVLQTREGLQGMLEIFLQLTINMVTGVASSNDYNEAQNHVANDCAMVEEALEEICAAMDQLAEQYGPETAREYLFVSTPNNRIPKLISTILLNCKERKKIISKALLFVSYKQDLGGIGTYKLLIGNQVESVFYNIDRKLGYTLEKYRCL